MKSLKNFGGSMILLLMATFLLAACSTPYKQQQAYKEAVSKSPALMHLYTTDIYNIYYDKILRKCVMHSISHEDEGNGIGVGVGIHIFDCKPKKIRKRAEDVLDD